MISLNTAICLNKGLEAKIVYCCNEPSFVVLIIPAVTKEDYPTAYPYRHSGPISAEHAVHSVRNKPLNEKTDVTKRETLQ